VLTAVAPGVDVEVRPAVMPRKKLTDMFVARVAPPTNGRIEYFDTTFPALALRVTESGHKSWSLFYRTGGRLRRWTIGPYPAFDPAAARKTASTALHRVADGGDPAEEKRARRNAPKPMADDFASVAREYVERQVKRNTAASTYRETARIIEQDVIPVWGKRSIRSIERRDVTALVDDKVASGAEIQANRILARLRTLFGWAVEKDRIPANPCDGLRPPTKEKSRDRILSDEEIRSFWRGADELKWPFGPLFKLLLLTAQRRDEVASMEWSEINFDTKLWSIPREKAKNDHGHDVQLSIEAVAIIRALPRVSGPYVFSTNGKTPVSGFSRAKERLDASMLAALKEAAAERGAETTLDPWILHDLRRTATTKMAALRVLPHVVDRILNHTSGTIRGVARVYNRFEYADERRTALEAWGRAIDAIVSGPAAPNVLELKARA
jgi:integrase